MAVSWSLAPVTIAVGPGADGSEYLIEWHPERVVLEPGAASSADFFPLFVGGTFRVSRGGDVLGDYLTVEAAQASVAQAALVLSSGSLPRA